MNILLSITLFFFSIFSIWKRKHTQKQTSKIHLWSFKLSTIAQRIRFQSKLKTMFINNFKHICKNNLNVRIKYLTLNLYKIILYYNNYQCLWARSILSERIMQMKYKLIQIECFFFNWTKRTLSSNLDTVHNQRNNINGTELTNVLTPKCSSQF